MVYILVLLISRRRRAKGMAKQKTEAMSVRAIVAIYRRFEAVARNADISLAQYRMMLYLQRGPKRAGAIAAAGAVKKPTVSSMLNSLREKGWITDARDPGDARVVAVSLTSEGKARMAAFEAELAASLVTIVPQPSLVKLEAALAGIYLTLAENEQMRLKDIENRMLSEGC